jgi:hypothetical protein
LALSKTDASGDVNTVTNVAVSLVAESWAGNGRTLIAEKHAAKKTALEYSI